ncbi:MAG: hypothetical protein JRH10_16895 [Deltaproteobacteria bacterium]|nr:hypothetical protein [Deltaproteobacteria bacterium]MBW2447011.1 hypothetical protein [Deltaproteobacteria bacterium]
MGCRIRSILYAAVLLGAAPAAAVPVSPLAVGRIAPSVREFAAVVVGDEEFVVTLDEAPTPRVREHGGSVLLSDGTVGSFASDQPPDFDAPR